MRILSVIDPGDIIIRYRNSRAHVWVVKSKTTNFLEVIHRENVTLHRRDKLQDDRSAKYDVLMLGLDFKKL